MRGRLLWLGGRDLWESMGKRYLFRLQIASDEGLPVEKFDLFCPLKPIAHFFRNVAPVHFPDFECARKRRREMKSSQYFLLSWGLRSTFYCLLDNVLIRGGGEAMRNRGESLIQKCQETNEITFEREALSIFSRECHSYSIWHSYPRARCDWIFNFFRIWQWRNMKRGPRIITSSFSFFGVSQKEIAHNFKLWSRWKAMVAKSGRPLNWDASSAGEKWRHFAKSTLLAARGKTFHIIPFQSSLSISLLDGVNDMQLGQTSHQFF